MFVKRVSLVVLACLISELVESQKCEADFQLFHDCLEYYKEATRYNLTRLISEINQCYIGNGCKAPNVNVVSNVSIGNSSSRNSSDTNNMKLCTQQIGRKIHSTIEKCVQRKLPDFTFPKKAKSNTDDERFNYRGTFVKQMKHLCPKDVVNETKACLLNLQEQLSNVVGRSRTCFAKKDCLSQMTLFCRNEFETNSRLICQCANEEVKPNGVQLEQEFYDCLGDNSTQPSISKGRHEAVVFVCHLDDDDCRNEKFVKQRS